MHLFKIPLLALLFTLFLSPVFAQTSGDTTNAGSIFGQIVDAQSKPVSYATVTLLRADSSVVNGDLTQDDGSFKISPAGIGSFRLRIQALGVATKTIAVQITADAPNKNMGKVKIAETENKLKEEVVTGERPIMELKVDKKVFNVEKNTTTAGGSAADVLQNVPSVSVDADGNVSLRGKTDVTILIDGKPSTLLGTDMASALQSLPAGSIESVEVITNPSAKYDAQGTGGIINIVTKKDGRFGLNGNLTLGAGTRDKYNGNFGLNARKGKWNAFLNSSYRLNNTYNDVTTDRYDKDSVAPHNRQSYHTYEHVPRRFYGSFNTIGVTYDPDKFNSITLTQNVNFMGFAFKDYSDYNTYTNPTESNGSSFYQNRYTDFSVNLKSFSSAIDYKHKFKKKDEELTVDGTFATTAIQRSQQFITKIIPDTGLGVNPIIENAPGTGSNSSLNVWADYSDPLFTKNGKLGLGFKSQFYWFNSSSNPVVDSAGRQDYVDYSLLSNFNYSQQTHAAYVNWSDQPGKFSYQAGLRIEDAIYDGNGKVPVDTTFHNSFFNFFPSAFVSYQLGNQQSIYLNYSRRTNRPGFMQLLPFKDFSNPGTVSMGNPNLIPEFINNIEFSYSKADNKGNNFILSAYYAYTENLTQRVNRRITAADSNLGLSGDVGTLLTQPINIASGTTYGLEGTGHVQILPIWDATINVNFFENKLVVGNIDTGYRKYLSDNSGYSWFGKINTNLKLPGNFSFQVNANYESPKVISQGSLKETYWVDVALRKNLWKNKATLVINCSDIFKTHTTVTEYNQVYYYETINRVKETRIGNITFTYRFGKSELGKKRGKRDDLKPSQPADEDRSKNLKDDDNDNGGAPGQSGQGGSGGGGNGGGGGAPHAHS